MLDLETDGHVIVYVTYIISACICLTAVIFFAIERILGHGIHSNYCHLRDSHVWPWNSRTRHGLPDVCYFWLYVSYRDDFFCIFFKFSGQGIHYNYCHSRDHHVWPWNARSGHGLRDLTTWQNKKSRRLMTWSSVFKITRKGHVVGNS